MAPEQIVFELFIGIGGLILIIAVITLLLYRFVPAYTKKMDRDTERIYKHPLGNSDIRIQDAMGELKRVNSFAQKKDEELEK